LEEPLPRELVDILEKSLKELPRHHVFGFYNDKKEFVPYHRNNAYSKFFMNTCKKLFGKPMGPSLWRHMYVSENLNPSEISFEEHERVAKLMGHSTGMQRLVYHWTDENMSDHEETDSPKKSNK
jgi:integrase